MMRSRVPHIQLYPVPQFATFDLTVDAPNEYEGFLRLSGDVTGFSLAELQTTGMTRLYFDELGLVLGREIRQIYFSHALSPTELFADPLWGPVTKNIARMWYLGQWKKLPFAWGSQAFSEKALNGFDEFGRNRDRIISPQAYQEGLVWKAVGVNPMGAKQPGFASWEKMPE